MVDAISGTDRIEVSPDILVPEDLVTANPEPGDPAIAPGTQVEPVSGTGPPGPVRLGTRQEPTGPAPHPRRSGNRVAVFWRFYRLPFWIVTARIGIGMVFAHLLLTLFPQSIQHLGFGTLNHGTWFGAFDRWDSAYYTSIAAHGYPVAQPVYSAFFPGYPLLIRLVHELSFGQLPYVQSAMVVSWASFTGATLLLYQLGVRHFDRRVALIATGLFCWFPASLFLLAPYSEALLALEILAVVALLDRRHFVAAAVVAGYASATSPQAIVLAGAVVLAAILARQAIIKSVGYAVISGAGLIAYGGFSWSTYGSPIEFDKVQKLWQRSENLPFFGLYRNVVALREFFVGPGPSTGGPDVTYANLKYVWILDDVALALAGVLTVVLVWLAVRPRLSARSGTGAHAPPRLAVPRTGVSIPASFLVVTLGIVLIAACTTIYPYGSSTFASTEGEARFVSVVFPLFLAAGYLLRRRPGLLVWVVGLSAAAALLFQALYNFGYWMT